MLWIQRPGREFLEHGLEAAAQAEESSALGRHQSVTWPSKRRLCWWAHEFQDHVRGSRLAGWAPLTTTRGQPQHKLRGAVDAHLWKRCCPSALQTSTLVKCSEPERGVWNAGSPAFRGDPAPRHAGQPGLPGDALPGGFSTRARRPGREARDAGANMQGACRGAAGDLQGGAGLDDAAAEFCSNDDELFPAQAGSCCVRWSKYECDGGAHLSGH